MIVGDQFGLACYVKDSIRSVLYLAHKYCEDPEGGPIANTNLGGDNAYRGAVLGALLGAANGFNFWPERWMHRLQDPPRELMMEK